MIATLAADFEQRDIGRARQHDFVPFAIGECRHRAGILHRLIVVERQTQRGAPLPRQLEKVEPRARLVAKGQLCERTRAVHFHQPPDERRNDAHRRAAIGKEACERRTIIQPYPRTVGLEILKDRREARVLAALRNNLDNRFAHGALRGSVVTQRADLRIDMHLAVNRSEQHFDQHVVVNIDHDRHDRVVRSSGRKAAEQPGRCIQVGQTAQLDLGKFHVVLLHSGEPRPRVPVRHWRDWRSTRPA